MINFCILIPFYNEENTIIKFANKIKHTNYNTILINDGSTDKSIKKLRQNKFHFYGYPKNKGKGYAIKYGVNLPNLKYDYYLIMDSDGQHSISDIANFLKMAEKYPNVGIFCGNRLSNPRNMPIIRRLTNYFMSWVVSLMIGQKVADSQCGMRLIKKEIFDLDLKENKFAFESEVLIKASKVRFKIKNLPIHTIYHKDRKSKIHPIKDTIRWIKMLWRLRNV